jgi:hypothetical protein
MEEGPPQPPAHRQTMAEVVREAIREYQERHDPQLRLTMEEVRTHLLNGISPPATQGVDGQGQDSDHVGEG